MGIGLLQHRLYIRGAVAVHSECGGALFESHLSLSGRFVSRSAGLEPRETREGQETNQSDKE